MTAAAWHRKADRAYRDARRTLDIAASLYALAAAHAAHARFLTRRPDLWEVVPQRTGNPAFWEAAAADAERFADQMLQASFAATDRARRCNDLSTGAKQEGQDHGRTAA